MPNESNAGERKHEWERGYFCAVAVYLKNNFVEVCFDSFIEEMFKAGGDWRNADPEDIATFRAHGLLSAQSNEGTNE